MEATPQPSGAQAQAHGPKSTAGATIKEPGTPQVKAALAEGKPSDGTTTELKRQYETKIAELKRKQARQLKQHREHARQLTRQKITAQAKAKAMGSLIQKLQQELRRKSDTVVGPSMVVPMVRNAKAPEELAGHDEDSGDFGEGADH